MANMQQKNHHDSRPPMAEGCYAPGYLNTDNRAAENEIISVFTGMAHPSSVLSREMGPANAREFNVLVSKMSEDYATSRDNDKSQLLERNLESIGKFVDKNKAENDRPVWKKLGSLVSLAIKTVGCSIVGDKDGVSENREKFSQAVASLFNAKKVSTALKGVKSFVGLVQDQKSSSAVSQGRS